MWLQAAVDEIQIHFDNSAYFIIILFSNTIKWNTGLKGQLKNNIGAVLIQAT